jgi:prephenate dehydratase
MAIENSIAGSILPNYNLLQRSNLVIAGEVVPANTAKLVGQSRRETGRHSGNTFAPNGHTAMFEFLDKHGLEISRNDDTALSAKHIHQHKNKYAAAIASKLAAELLDSRWLVPNIHTLKNNYTRFLILKREDGIQKIAGADKASVTSRQITRREASREY